MKRFFLIAMTLILSVSVFAQQKIQLRSADKVECVKSDMNGLQATFSFSTIEAQDQQRVRRFSGRSIWRVHCIWRGVSGIARLYLLKGPCAGAELWQDQ